MKNQEQVSSQQGPNYKRVSTLVFITKQTLAEISNLNGLSMC